MSASEAQAPSNNNTGGGLPNNGNKISDKEILITSWSLSDPEEHGKRKSGLELEYFNDNAPEAVFDDQRKVVNPEDIRPGGKYRSIIKLFIRYEKNPQAEAMGTGWLIAPDVLVTAGHCAFARGFGRAVSIRAYQGYNGKKSIGTPNVNYRYGTQVATTPRWVEGYAKPGDFSVVKLNEEFPKPVQPINYTETPLLGVQSLIGVVGYPGDKKKFEERGAQMYEMFLSTDYDRRSSEFNMLDYEVSTFAGQSGSPVLVKKGDTYTSIGVHTYGGRSVNTATVLDKTDNHVPSYLSFLQKKLWEDAKKGSPTTGGPAPAGVDYYIIDLLESSESSSEDSDEAEGFFDIIKSVGKVVLPFAGDVLTAGAPFLGPIGAVVAPLAGIALHGAAKLAETSLVSDTESAVHVPNAHEKQAAIHRAILGEAALHAISRLPEDTLRKSGALKTMHTVYSANEDTVKNLTPHISKALLEPTLRISMSELHKAHNPGRPQAPKAKKWAPIVGAESVLVGAESEDETSEFIRNVVAHDSEVVDEAFFPDLLNVLKKGAIFAAPFVTGLARKGLDKLDEVVAKSGTESELLDAPETVLELLPKRALLGEAALQALIKLPKEHLEKSYPKPGSDSETEGLFDVFKTVIQKIGPKVLDAAPIVLKHVTPIISDLLAPRAN